MPTRNDATRSRLSVAVITQPCTGSQFAFTRMPADDYYAERDVDERMRTMKE
jgi:hypothetical protein